MNKNTVIGFILIGIVMFGFTWYQSKQYEKQVKYKAEQDSIAAVKSLSTTVADSCAKDSAVTADTKTGASVPKSKDVSHKGIYKDSLLEYSRAKEAQFPVLSNDKIEIVFSTKGAQPYSVRLKNFKNYDGSPLYIFNKGQSELGYSIFAGENINTKDFVFDIAESNDSVLVMKLPFSGGGYISMEYRLERNAYSLKNVLKFKDMENVIPRNVSVFDMDWKVTIPRMEKGYKNESQYSKLDYYFSGEKKVSDIGKGRDAEKRIDNKLSWFAFQQQFFSAILRAENEFSNGNLSIKFIPQEDESHNLMTCEANMRTDFTIGSEVTVPYEFYFGPNHFKTLKSYNQKYEKIIPLGGWLVGWFTRFIIIPLFDFLHRFISNFGIIILLMTIFIKIVVLPFSYKSYSSTAKMQAIKPEIDKLNEKFPKQEDAMKKQQATMELYRRAGINPMGGCLPMLFQFPILWAMFRFFPASIELRQQGFLWAEDLSAYDSIKDFGVNIPLLGDHISIFALLMAVSMFFYSKITTSGQMSGNDPNSSTMRFMSIYIMPIMMFFICNNLSSGLSYYYLLSNLITMLETFIIKKFFINPDEIMARLKASEGKPVQKSKWQLRLEQAQKMQQAMEKQRKQGR